MARVAAVLGGPAQTCTSSYGYRDLVAYEIDFNSDVPSYRQLADQLRAKIDSGEIAHRQLLPSINQLVGETGLAVGTVRKAISVLVEQNLAYVVHGRGTFAGPR